MRQLLIPVSKPNGQEIMADTAMYRGTLNDARAMSRKNRRAGKWPELDTLVYKLYLALDTLGHRRMAITTALLQEDETLIAVRLDVADVSASHGWLRGFFKRRDICSVAMHEQAGDANLSLAASATQEIGRKLESYRLERKVT